eukprot:gb/GECG01001466.1/.p1 GENE.gb/GECG01001466.1/~~gb/GECG01001466.1/.p1  ORF type:complete len:280 (+),score=30.98 gb/GECG01001466.1/:1-840(+)
MNKSRECVGMALRRWATQSSLYSRNQRLVPAGTFGSSPRTPWTCLRHGMAEYGTTADVVQPEATDSLDRVWELLQRGNQRFIEGKVGKFSEDPHKKSVRERRRELVPGQAPVATILTCSDSRISPELVFDCDMGKLFVVRNAGNVLSEDAVATIQFAVEVTRTPLVMVLGHEDCKAVSLCVDSTADGANIRTPNASTEGENMAPMDALMAKLRPAVLSAAESSDYAHRSELCDNAVEYNVTHQLQQLSNIEVVRKANEEGRVKLLGLKYKLESGEVATV